MGAISRAPRRSGVVADTGMCRSFLRGNREISRLTSSEVSGTALVCIGNAYFDKKDYERAIADYSEAIRLDPEYAFAFNNRCWVRAVTDRDLQQALADCTQSLRVKPNSALAFANRGLVHLKSGDFDKAIADYDVALRISPTMAVPLYGRGLAKQKKGDTAGGDIDIAAANAIKADIAEEYARYGVKTNDTIAAPPIPPPSPVQQSRPSPVIPNNNDSDEDKSGWAKAKQLEATPN